MVKGVGGQERNNECAERRREALWEKTGVLNTPTTNHSQGWRSMGFHMLSTAAP